jgi:hypothetical protein
MAKLLKESLAPEKKEAARQGSLTAPLCRACSMVAELLPEAQESLYQFFCKCNRFVT